MNEIIIALIGFAGSIASPIIYHEYNELKNQPF